MVTPVLPCGARSISMPDSSVTSPRTNHRCQGRRP
jgi:hypothetical protein